MGKSVSFALGCVNGCGNVSGVVFLLGKKGLVRSLFRNKNSALEVVILLFRNYFHVMFLRTRCAEQSGTGAQAVPLGKFVESLGGKRS